MAPMVWLERSVLGMEDEHGNWDENGAQMNNVQTKTLLKDADNPTNWLSLR